MRARLNPEAIVLNTREDFEALMQVMHDRALELGISRGTMFLFEWIQREYKQAVFDLYDLAMSRIDEEVPEREIEDALSQEIDQLTEEDNVWLTEAYLKIVPSVGSQTAAAVQLVHGYAPEGVEGERRLHLERSANDYADGLADDITVFEAELIYWGRAIINEDIFHRLYEDDE
jgi:hypothetical protein